MEKIRVAYNIRSLEKNILEDRAVTFSNFQEALEHVKQLKTRKDIMGIPVIEVI